MNQHSSSKRKYYFPLIGTALLVASLFSFSFPIFAAGTEAGTKLRNTATGNYEDDEGNEYTIESNTVDVTVAKVAGITNLPTGFTDNTSSTTNTTVLTGDEVSFEFTITNVGNDISNIFIPAVADLATKGLDVSSLTLEVSQVNPGSAPTFTPQTAATTVPDVPVNGEIIVRVTGDVTATAAGAPIEVLLGDTGSNLDPNAPVADTQNRPDDGADQVGSNPVDVAQAVNEVRTETANNPGVAGAPLGGQKEASALQQVLLGSNPLAMTTIKKTRGTMQEQGPLLDDNIIPYSLDLEVLNTTPNSFYTPGDLEGRDYTPGGANQNTATFAGITDVTNLILVSDVIPAGTALATNLPTPPQNGWIAVYSTDTTGDNADEIAWTTTPPPLADVTSIGWVYDANASGPITPGTTVTAAQGQFTFNLITSGLSPTDGGTVANIAQVFGGTVNGEEIFDESGDQDPSNFNGANEGPDEDDPQSTGVANPATHDVDNGNDNTGGPSPGGEDNVITIGAPGQLINGPEGQPAATGDVFGIGPDNNHDFQNKGVDNFPANAQHNAGDTFDPNVVSFTNTLSNPGTTDLSDVLLQPINAEFFAAYNGTTSDTDLPDLTEVTLTLGGQTAIYTYYHDNPNTPAAGDTAFVLTGGTPIVIPTLAAGVPLDYNVDIDLPPGTGLSTDDAINHGYAVPIIAFIDDDASGSPNFGENNNFTVNQVYTGHIKISKQVRILDPNGTLRPGMDFADPDVNKPATPEDILEYRVIYRNISEAQAGTGNNVVLNGVNVMIDEDGTLDAIDGGGLDQSGNNWALDTNTDGNMDTTNVQNTAVDSNGGTINFFTGESTALAPSLGTLVPAGTVDPGITVTGYRSTVPLLAPSGAEDLATTPALAETVDPGDSTLIFQREID